MNVLSSYGRGLQEALVRLPAVFILWLFNAAFGAVVYFAAAGALAGPLARSLSGDLLLSEGSVDVLIELLTGSGQALGGLTTLVLILLGFYQIVTPFLYGGILGEMVRPREAQGFLASFGGGGGKYYGRFLRVSLLSILLWIPAAAVFYLAGRGLGAFGIDAADETAAFWLVLVRIAIGLFLFFLVKMILDYARIRIAVTEGRSALAALGWACLFVLRKIGPTLALYYALGFTAAAGTAVYGLLMPLAGGAGPAAMLGGFFLAQVHILWRCWIKVAYQAAEVRLAALAAL
jgi:hypothetical protein